MYYLFWNILQENPSKHPIIILKDVPFSHLQSILEFMYAGEVNISQEQLPAFLKTADRLKVRKYILLSLLKVKVCLWMSK